MLQIDFQVWFKKKTKPVSTAQPNALQVTEFRFTCIISKCYPSIFYNHRHTLLKTLLKVITQGLSWKLNLLDIQDITVPKFCWCRHP